MQRHKQKSKKSSDYDYRKILSLLDGKGRGQLPWLFLGMLLMGFFEVAGIVSIVPFMAVATNPSIIHENSYLAYAYQLLSFENDTDFTFVLGLCVFVMLAVNNAFGALMIWLTSRFANMQGHRLSQQLFSHYLHQPYTFFLNRNTSELAKNILFEVNRVLGGAVMPAIRVVTKVIIALFILILLLVVEPLLALTVASVLGFAYLLVYLSLRKKLLFLGQLSTESQKLRYKITNEAISGIKEVKLYNNEQVFSDKYQFPSVQYASCAIGSEVISQLPRFIMETVAYGGVLGIVLYYIAVEKEASQIIPVISLYAFAGYRLMPALQQIFAGVTHIRYNFPALQIINDDFVQNRVHVPGEVSMTDADDQDLAFDDELKLESISFTYPMASSPALDGVDLAIPHNTTIGFVGKTGSGKTTTADLLLGLLEPSEGNVILDGKALGKGELVRWRKHVGYVPQGIYLTDDTIAGNIAFGIPDEEIDPARIKKAADIAEIGEFINSLEQGYDTLVGDRGVRLSGGQKQRIGIARALYRNPAMLVFDEATSALDGITENAIMDAIKNLSHEKTIILIAHRLATVKNCDRIFFFENGRVRDSGTYNELMERSEDFRRMAQVGTNDM